MKTIRMGTFETNSSSTHSITIMTRKEYDGWKSGCLVYDEDDEKFISTPKINKLESRMFYLSKNSEKLTNGYIYNNTFYDSLEKMEKEVSVADDILEEFIQDNSDYTTYEDFTHYSDIEESFYTTKGGEEIVAISKYNEG